MSVDDKQTPVARPGLAALHGSVGGSVEALLRSAVERTSPPLFPLVERGQLMSRAVGAIVRQARAAIKLVKPDMCPPRRGPVSPPILSHEFPRRHCSPAATTSYTTQPSFGTSTMIKRGSATATPASSSAAVV